MKQSLSALLAMALLLPLLSTAAPLRIGVINKQKVIEFANSKKFLELDKHYQAPEGRLKLSDLRQQASKLEVQYQQQQGKMTAGQKQQLGKQLLKLEQQINKRRGRFARQHAQQRLAREERLKTQWEKSLKQVAKENNISLILDKKGVFFAEEVVDLTDKVIQKVTATLQQSTSKAQA
jgi:Skp family chaperone for outer membrane proteins